jgi:hypothetical protein
VIPFYGTGTTENTIEFLLAVKHLFRDQTREKFHCANQLAHIAHFIIVPANSFYQLCIANRHYFGLCCIEQRTEMGADDIGAYNFIFVV